MWWKGANVAGCAQWATKSAPKNLATQQRTFSNSLKCQKRGVIPVFQKSSPELDDTLALIREKIILPGYLSKAQQKLIYNSKKKRMLEIEPILAKIGGEEFRLQYVNRLTDVPNTREQLFKALSLMADNNDFNNLPQLLQGLHKARYNIVYDSKAYGVLLNILRKARRHDILLECFRRASETGLTLSNRRIALEAMQTLYREALESEWDAKETKKTLNVAEMLLDLMEDPNHVPKNALKGDVDPQASPEVIALPLALAATRASKHLDGKDQEGKVDRLARRLLATWDNLRTPDLDTRPHSLLPFKNRWLYEVVLTQHGIRAAQSVLGPDSDVAIELKEKLSDLEETIKSVYTEIVESTWGKEKPRIGPVAYDQVFRTESV